MLSIARHLRGFGRSKPGAYARLDYSHPLAQGLVCAWMINEGGSTVRDLTKNVIHGTISGGCTRVPGNFNAQALQFNGSTGFVSASDTKLPLGNAQRTVSFWFLTSASYAMNTHAIAFQYGNVGVSGQYFLLAIGTDISGFQTNGFGVNSQYSTGLTVTGLNDGKWHHSTVVSVSTGTWHLYIDGVYRGAQAQTRNTVSSGTMYFGKDSLNRYWNGRLDQLLIYDRALSAAEIRSLYQHPFAMLKPWPMEAFGQPSPETTFFASALTLSTTLPASTFSASSLLDSGVLSSATSLPGSTPSAAALLSKESPLTLTSTFQSGTLSGDSLKAVDPLTLTTQCPASAVSGESRFSAVANTLTTTSLSGTYTAEALITPTVSTAEFGISEPTPQAGSLVVCQTTPPGATLTPIGSSVTAGGVVAAATLTPAFTFQTSTTFGTSLVSAGYAQGSLAIQAAAGSAGAGIQSGSPLTVSLISLGSALSASSSILVGSAQTLESVLANPVLQAGAGVVRNAAQTLIASLSAVSVSVGGFGGQLIALEGSYTSSVFSGSSGGPALDGSTLSPLDAVTASYTATISLTGSYEDDEV